MSEPKPNDAAPADCGASVNSGESNSATPSGSAVPEQLTKEEQWALFEKELKESDWGHQPC